MKAKFKIKLTSITCIMCRSAADFMLGKVNNKWPIRLGPHLYNSKFKVCPCSTDICWVDINPKHSKDHIKKKKIFLFILLHRNHPYLPGRKSMRAFKHAASVWSIRWNTILLIAFCIFCVRWSGINRRSVANLKKIYLTIKV